MTSPTDDRTAEPKPMWSKERSDDPEAVWLREVYQPDATNLTVRAVIGGALIGALMCLSNIYVFFKTGWSLGVTVTACILAFAAFKALQAFGARPLGLHENNALTTVASGAGFMTGGGNMAAYGALLMVTTLRPDDALLVLWFAVIAAMGVFCAIPIKRQLINREALPFPTGTATAETLRSIYSGQKGNNDVKLLGYAALFAVVLGVLRGIVKWIPGTWAFPASISGHTLQAWGLSFKTEVVYIGAGALMSFRTGWSLLLGAVLCYGFIAPWAVGEGLIATTHKLAIFTDGQLLTDTTGVSYKLIVQWTVWPGAALLVGAGLTSFALDYKSLVRAISGLTQVFRPKRAPGGISDIECPEWWFPVGFTVLGPIVVALMWWMFDIPLWAAIISIPLAVVMGFIASRVTGETDVTPTKALGPLTQMMYGGLTPGNLSGNIMSGNVTGGIGLHAADLLTTLKTGWLVGAKPRHQLYAQLFGVCVGAAVVVPLFNIVIPDPSVLGSKEWEAPSCAVWAGVSEAFAGGLDKLGIEARIAIGLGLSLGIVLALVEKFAPKRIVTYVPTASGLGLAFVLTGSSSIMMFLGALLGEICRRRQQQGLVTPVASGLIAGESLIGVVIALLISGGVIAK